VFIFYGKSNKVLAIGIRIQRKQTDMGEDSTRGGMLAK
jgi:hypothetical protein